ncbi:CPBP family glutamic-type intramembrane protease [Alkalicoccobacillus gibsonii]|uniref:CPBP family glutamic-type intramembrane protease n=1 Tax=Alkalicoccobacillus gibsonii TaxID=79881 RepID=UPI003F7CD2C3
MFTRPQIGRNKHRHYLLSCVVLFLSFIIGMIIYLETKEAILKPGMSNKLVQLIDNLGISIFSLIMIFGIAISIRFVHQRPFKTLITGHAVIRWRLLFIGMGVIAICMAIMYPIAMLISPSEFVYNGIDNELFLFILLSAVFAIPIQTTLEELFFRGFLLQWFGTFIKSTLLLCTVIIIIFAAMHFFNPEMTMNPFVVAGGYVIMSVAYTVSTFVLKGTEFTIGVHAANNMLLMTFFLFSENALLAPMALWTINYSTSAFLVTIYGMNLLWLGFVLIFRKRLLKLS